MWVLAGIWHTILAVQFYNAETEAKHEGLGLIFLAYLILGFLMTFLYQYGYAKGKPVLEGLFFGGIIGILWVFPHELAMAGAHGESIGYVMKNAVWHIVEQGVGGMVIGLVYKKYPLVI